MTLHSPTFDYTVLLCISLPYMVLHCIPLHFPVHVRVKQCSSVHVVNMQFQMLSMRCRVLKFAGQTAKWAVPGTIWPHGTWSGLLAVCLALVAD